MENSCFRFLLILHAKLNDTDALQGEEPRLKLLNINKFK